MRTASGRARGLLAFLLLALSAAWVLLRRRSGAPAALPSGSPARTGGPAPGLARWVEPGGPSEAAARDAEPGELPGDVLATDAGLTAEPALAGQATTATLPAVEPATALSEAPTAEIPAVAPAGAAGADDLRALRGVGRSIERILNDQGITTYRQLAELDGAELERVRAALPDFRARIEREDWVGQARELHLRKYGEAL